MQLNIRIQSCSTDYTAKSKKELDTLIKATEDLVVNAQQLTRHLHSLNITDKTLDYTYSKLKQSFPLVDRVKELTEGLDLRIDRLVTALGN